VQRPAAAWDKGLRVARPLLCLPGEQAVRVPTVADRKTRAVRGQRGQLKSNRYAEGHNNEFFSIIFPDLPVALVGNFMFKLKRISDELKAYLKPPRIIPVAILLVEIRSPMQCMNQVLHI
jgi:hypothetical protein